ncbi:MAG: nickel pincer cofactor biosynthesis protein LarC [Bacteroidales bacterium]|nr:nickel pincer cofactor biosynthesis protein LarC [Bacteroidales bacterium]
MRILYYDCFAGISGDMNLGAMIDAGVPESYLTAELEKLKVGGYKIHVSKSLKMGISGTLVHVELINTAHHSHHDDHHSHGHHAHDHHTHKDHTHEHHSHEHRNLSMITEIIQESGLNEYVREKSLLMFREIAVAEAKIHAKSIDEIHFHEVGAIDSIVDVVGAAICMDYLKPDKVMASTVEVGGGFVECAHGTFPVPAPATAEILKDIPIKKGAVQTETTTPTGAAILKVFVNEFTDQTRFSVQQIAYGLGYKDMNIPNVLRVYMADTKEEVEYASDSAIQIECNIDDMNPEQYEYIMSRLFESGAHDVFLVPMIMKKSRPAIQLNVLCHAGDREKMERIILDETSSIGIRYYPLTKTMLKRSVRTLDTLYGPIRIKEAYESDHLLKYKAEYDDCVKAAQNAKVSLREIYREVEKCVEKNRKP